MAEIPNIKPNSNKYREKTSNEDEHRVSKVTKGHAVKNQETTLQKFAKGFIPEDAKSVKEHVKEYVIEETPGLIQGFLRRFFQNILDACFPENGKYLSCKGGTFRTGNSQFRYDAIRANGTNGGAYKSRSSNTVYEYENVVFEDYGDAQDVLDGLYDCLERYEKVRVFDLYDLAGVVANATDRNYGWTDLRGSKIISVKEGWVIDLPRAIPLT